MTPSKLNVVTTKKSRSASFLLITTIADTTWRIFLPTLIGMWTGTLLDGCFKTKIVFTLILLIAGFAMGIVLILRQLKKVSE